MLRYLLLLSVIFCGATSLSACTCSGPPTFCQTFGPRLLSGNVNIFAGRPLAFREITIGSNFVQPVVDIVVTDTLYGSFLLPGDTITLIGQDGVNCAVSLGIVNDTLEQIFGVDHPFRMAGNPAEFQYPNAELTGCGRSVLQVHDGMVFGPIAPEVDSLSYEEFRTNEDYCVAGPPPEGCGCVTLAVDFCDEAASLSQQGKEPSILRIQTIPSDYQVYEWEGFGGVATHAVVTEVLLSNDLSVGDTITIIRDSGSGCILSSFSEDMLWQYTFIDRAGGAESPRFRHNISPYPLLQAPNCIQRDAVIVDEMVLTLPGPVPYDEYLDQLADCVPAVSTLNLSNQIGLQVYPNPASNRVNIAWDGSRVNEVALVGSGGRLVMTQSPATGAHNLRLAVDGVPAGVYFVRLRTAEGVATRRMVITR